MLIRSCFQCKFHEIKEVNSERVSRCVRENCYSRYSKCIANKALDRYLEQESSKQNHPFPTLTHTYPHGIAPTIQINQTDDIDEIDENKHNIAHGPAATRGK
jgi:hypothetical protein